MEKETIIIEEEIMEELFYYLKIKKAFPTWTQDPEVMKEMIDIFDYIKNQKHHKQNKKDKQQPGGQVATHIAKI